MITSSSILATERYAVFGCDEFGGGDDNVTFYDLRLPRLDDTSPLFSRISSGETYLAGHYYPVLSFSSAAATKP